MSLQPSIKTVKATGFPVEAIAQLDADDFEALDWTGASEELLLKFFPYQPNMGTLHPPSDYDISSSTKVRRWRGLLSEYQEFFIDNAKKSPDEFVPKIMEKMANDDVSTDQAAKAAVVNLLRGLDDNIDEATKQVS